MVTTRHNPREILEFVGYACHSVIRELVRSSQNREQKMTTSEVGLFVIMAIACILWAICSYAVGYKEGHKDGYQRGKAVGRHASSQAVR
jgi:hypothetical protein